MHSSVQTCLTLNVVGLTSADLTLFPIAPLPPAMSSTLGTTTKASLEAALRFCMRGVYASRTVQTVDSVHLCPRCLQKVTIKLAALDTENAEIQQFWKRQLRGEARHFWHELVLLTLRELDTPGIAALQLRFTEAREICNTCLKCNAKGTALTFNDTMCLAFELLGLCMTSGNPPIHHRLKFSSNGTWPERVSDILPYDPKTSFVGLFFWWKRIDSLHVDRVLNCWLNLFESDFRPTLTRYRDTFVPGLIAGLSSSVDRVEYASHTGSYTLTDGESLYARFMLARDIVTDLKSRVTDANTTAAGYEGELIQLINRVMSAFAKISSAGFRHQFDLQVVETAMNMIMFLKIRIGDSPSEADMELLSSLYSLGGAASGFSGDAYKAFQGNVLGFRSQPQCDELSCTRYGRLDASRLQKCGRCLSVTYCSPACQRAHWNTTVRPHKMSCPIFAELRAIAAFDSDPDKFSAAYKAAHVKYGLMARALYHFMCLFNRIETPHTLKEEEMLMNGRISICCAASAC